jgi:hypothetical protein
MNFTLPRLSSFVLVLLAVLLHGCALQAPAYSPNASAIERARNSGVQPATVGGFTVRPGATGADSISLRGNPMASPVGSNYAAYLAEALRTELRLAGKLDPKSTLEISGELLSNDIAAGGFSTNSGHIEARFIVKVGGQTRYDAVKRVEESWDSSFVGAVAIPKAQQQYPVLVQQLLGTLWADPKFVAALK